jgi:PmbA protein
MKLNKDDCVFFLLEQAMSLGADAGDAVFAQDATTAVTIRLGKPERIERTESRHIGLRAFVGNQSASAASSDLRPDALRALAERVVAMARVTPPDAATGIAAASELGIPVEGLDLADPDSLTAEHLSALAKNAENAALAVKGVNNSDGADAHHSRSFSRIISTSGLDYASSHTSSGLSVSVLAGNGTAMERDYEFSSAVYANDLMNAAALGTKAGYNTVQRLNPRRIVTGTYPVLFSPRVASSLLRSLLSAINGSTIVRGTSFLKDKLNTSIFAPSITIVEDPHRRRGHRSRPLDAEGLATIKTTIIHNGVLTTWLLDRYTANRLNTHSNGHASRGVNGAPNPSASNVYIEPGTNSESALCASVPEAFYVTDLMGMGVNLVTGDYSQGASGFWLRNGERAFPVSEVTIAGHLNTIFANLIAADNLEFRTGIDSPTLLVPAMTIAGD